MTARLLILLLVLPAAFGLIVFFSIAGQFAATESQNLERFGAASASQLSQHLSQYVIEEDLLSLNVLVTHLAESPALSTISVYNEANQLIAQAGRAGAGEASFTAEMSFQDATIGFVRITVPSSETSLVPAVLLLFVIYAAYAAVLVKRGERLTGYARGTTRRAGGTPDATEHVKDTEQPETLLPGVAIDAPMEQSILVVRVRPAHRMEQHFERFFHAAQLYGGVVEQTTAEELVIQFEASDAMYKASCAGLLIREIIGLTEGNIRFGGTVSTLGEDPDKRRKAASYLASISESDLLVARGDEQLKGRADLQSFHHSLVDDRDLKRIVSVMDSSLLHSQARQLAS